ncbi:MAG TPA: MarR family transcriptional regulator [Candidatus Paceibacterota bacterium]|jgi:DNA-binding MarR family transcriptional regulator|nr:MarR family transcriptional regulator [Candidatus Paceibacterota bacterium]
MSLATKPKSTSRTADIASLLVSLTRSMYKTMRTVAPACSFLEMKTLTIAYEHKNPAMKYIADELGISSPAVTAIIDRLVENKDVERYEDEADRRVTRISLTSQGKKNFEKNRAAIYEAFNERASALTESEQIELSRILTKLQHNQ